MGPVGTLFLAAATFCLGMTTTMLLPGLSSVDNTSPIAEFPARIAQPPIAPAAVTPPPPPSPSRLSNLDARLGDPAGIVWSRWDMPHNVNHRTWIVQGARFDMASRTVLLPGAADRAVQLSVRNNVIAELLERKSPPKCTRRVPVGMFHIFAEAEFWGNYWHWHVDTIYLLFHTLQHEYAEGHVPWLLSSLPRPLQIRYPYDWRKTPWNGTVPTTIDAVNVWQAVTRFVNETLRTSFGGPDNVHFLGGPQVPPRGHDVVCFDRLYVGSDRQCANIGEGELGNNEGSECQPVWKVWRQFMWRAYQAETPLLQATDRPIVFTFIVRKGSVQGKRLLNEADTINATKAVLTERYGPAGPNSWQLEELECEDMHKLVNTWARSSVIAISHGACQANVPMTRDGAAVLFIDVCPGKHLMLTPVPDYFLLFYHPIENALPDTGGGCNFVDYSINVRTWALDVHKALDAVHPLPSPAAASSPAAREAADRASSSRLFRG